MAALPAVAVGVAHVLARRQRGLRRFQGRGKLDYSFLFFLLFLSKNVVKDRALQNEKGKESKLSALFSFVRPKSMPKSRIGMDFGQKKIFGCAKV